MNIIILTLPTAEPHTLDQVKAYCRVTHSYEDAEITAMAKAARAQCEAGSRRSFLSQTRRVELAVPRFNSTSFRFDSVLHDPDDIVRGIRLPGRDVSALTEIKGIAQDGTLKLISNEHVVFDAESSSVRWKPSLWSALSGFSMLRIDYTAGSAKEVFHQRYPDLADAILALTDFKYTHRGEPAELPSAIRNALNAHWTSTTYSLP